MRGFGAGVAGDERSVLLGVVLMVASMAFLSALDAISKHLAADFSGVQVAWGRYVFHLAPLVLFAGPTRLKRMARTARPVAQIVRSTALAASSLSMIVAFGLMPLADAVAISFINPLVVVALSWRFLGERVGPHRWAAVIAGFIGMLVLVWPSGNVFEAGAPFAIAAAVFWAIGITLTRHVRDDDPLATLFYTALVGAILITLAVPFFWAPPSITAWGLMATMGLLGGVGHVLIIYAFRTASASLLAPYGYTALVWAIFYGWLLFAEFPDLKAAMGSAIIVAAGLYAWRREQARAPA